MEEIHLDLTGLRCPAPIVRLNGAARSLPEGAILHAIASDPAFELDVQAWCRRTGYELKRFTATGDRYEAWVRKGG